MSGEEWGKFYRLATGLAEKRISRWLFVAEWFEAQKPLLRHGGYRCAKRGCGSAGADDCRKRGCPYVDRRGK